MPQNLKKAAALAALDLVDSGMTIGIGTGSTAEFFIHALAEKIKQGLDIQGVPTSDRTDKLCENLGVPLTNLNMVPVLDMTIDGADEIDGDKNLIKGGGGALLREKIVASASKEMVVIADGSKRVKTLGAFPLPIEIVPFGLAAVEGAIRNALHQEGLDGELKWRLDGQDPFMTDGGHVILDAHLNIIPDAPRLESILNAIPGVVDSGLFINLCSKAYIAGGDGVFSL